MQVHVNPQNTSMGVPNSAHVSFTTPAIAALVTVRLGFRPRKVELYNATTPTSAVKTLSMAGAATFVRDADGAATVADAVTITEDGFTVASAVAGAAQTWHAYAIH